MWIGHLYEGPGIAPNSTSCHIHLPLTTDCLQEVICHLQSLSQHNIIPTLLVLGACACTGKTTALRCGLSMCGVYPTRFSSKASLEKYNSLCCDSQLPLGIDDPRSKASISDLAISLFNGARGGTMKHGEIVPKCMAIIASNFTTKEQEQ